MATNPIKFINETRAEIAKVVWPTRREVVLTTIMVFIMAALMATFFSIVDLGIRQALQAVPVRALPAAGPGALAPAGRSHLLRKRVRR